MKMNILQEILEQLKQINEKLSIMPIIHTYDSIKPGDVYCTNDTSEYIEKFQASTNIY